MKFSRLHSWPDSLAEARKIQIDLAGRIEFKSIAGMPEVVAAGDIAYSSKEKIFFACAVVFKGSDIIEEKYETGKEIFPYIPGFLSFREVPPLLRCFAELKNKPELVFVDGHGIAHPRKLGLASHLGLWLDIPTIGIAKKKLVGKYKEPVDETGFYSYLTYREEVVGAALKCRKGTKPVFVSSGHLIDLDSSLKIVKQTIDGYRIPYPTRIADKLVAEYKRKKLA
jgi:deoxyribonuclease V